MDWPSLALVPCRQVPVHTSPFLVFFVLSPRLAFLLPVAPYFHGVHGAASKKKEGSVYECTAGDGGCLMILSMGPFGPNMCDAHLLVLLSNQQHC